MLKSLQNKLAALFAAVVLIAVPMAMPALAHADTANIQGCLSGGTNLSAGTGAGCPSGTVGGGTDKINTLITSIVNIFSAVVGVISVIMIIVGGFRYITSGGDTGNVSSAKNTIVYAVIGLVVVAMAQFIVQFVLNKLTGAN